MSSSNFKPEFGEAIEAADAIRRKKTSARELVALTHRRIDLHNPKLNAIVWQNREQAVARAKQADEALARGDSVGPLHGVPITIKESFALRSSPNTWGMPALQHAMSPRTAIAVERLESAGAIIVGKTNVPVMLGDWQSFNPIYGTTNNPWDLSLTAGGSTGGGAAALAAGLGYLTMGSDLAGSIRIPSHFCGVYGHKPSLGLVSTAGFQPAPWDGSPGFPMDLTVVGPMARSARDLALALEVLGGPEADDARAWTWRMPAPRHKNLRDYRVGCVMNDPAAPITSEVAALYDSTISSLDKAGVKIESGWPDGVDSYGHMKTLLYLLFALVTAGMDDAARAQLSDRLRNNPDDVFAAAAAAPHARWLGETQQRLAYRARWQKYFQSHDVFLLPTTIATAFPHDHSEPMDNRFIETPEGRRPYAQQIPFWIGYATLAGLPATVAPIGRTRSGLPVGIQILAPMWEDATSIEFAALMSELIGGFAAPPSFE